MILLVCSICKKPLSLDETKLPAREVQFPCPSCKHMLMVDGRTYSDPRHSTSPRSERREETTPTAKAGNGKDAVAEKSLVVATECTSCKATLEIEQASLSRHDATVLKCPSCGTMLTVDRRKLQASAGGGPVVRVASATYKPLPATPSQNELEGARETAEYVQVLSDFYAGAEQYLEMVIEVGNRTNALREAQKRGSDALDAIAVRAPAPTDHYVREAAQQPNLRTVDGALITEASYLHHVRGVTETAVRLHPLLRAPQRYAPAMEWQKETYAALRDAYGAAVSRSTKLSSLLDQLREKEKAYRDVCARHLSDQRALEGKLAEHNGRLGKLSNDIEEAEKQINSLEDTAKQQGWRSLKDGGGCGAAIGAAVLAIVFGIAAESAGVGFLMFFVFGGIIAYVIYQYGYGKSVDARVSASARLGELRDERDAASTENKELREKLADHIKMDPITIAQTIPIAQWSPVFNDDLDAGKPSLVVTSPASPPRQHTETFADAAGT